MKVYEVNNYAKRMDYARRLVDDMPLTVDVHEYEQDASLYLIEDIAAVVGAMADDLQDAFESCDGDILSLDSDEGIAGFLDRHGIEWK